MRSLRPPFPPEEGIQEFERMQAEGLGLRLLLTFLPAGAALEDARALHGRMAQAGRPPCSFLDREPVFDPRVLAHLATHGARSWGKFKGLLT